MSKPWVLVLSSPDYGSDTSFHETAEDALTEAFLKLGVTDMFDIKTKDQIKAEAQRIVNAHKECEFDVRCEDYYGEECSILNDSVHKFHQIIVEDEMKNFPLLEGFSQYEDFESDE